MMQRRALLSGILGTVLSLVGLGSGCAVPRISKAARDPERGDPWRCRTCGYLTRSTEDISGKRCPRCYTKKQRRISEEEFAKWLQA